VDTDDRSRKAVFLDKDGTLLEDVPYNVEPARMRLQHGAAQGVQRLHTDGFAIVVVSNQSGVARGYFDESALMAVEMRLRQMVNELGVPLTGFCYCPHHPDGVVPRYAIECDCRKPKAGMVLRAACEHGLSLGESWLIGDILDDVEAGRGAGCRTILIANGGETMWRINPARLPDFVASDLTEAAAIIHSESNCPLLALRACEDC